MLTQRSFLAFAAAAQLLSPVVRAMQVRDAQVIAARLPQVSVQTHAGRDVYFCNDPVSGRLGILNLQYADSDSLLLPPARQARGGVARPYLHSLTLQPGFGDPAALHRYMERYAMGHPWLDANGASQEIELVRLRLGMYIEG